VPESDPELVEEFGEALARVRRVRGMTQWDVALRSGLSPMSISHYERGRGGKRQYPSWPILQRLAAALWCEFRIAPDRWVVELCPTDTAPETK
jgi:transcriptional regulator with XRE-family HTH domain